MHWASPNPNSKSKKAYEALIEKANSSTYAMYIWLQTVHTQTTALVRHADIMATIFMVISICIYMWCYQVGLHPKQNQLQNKGWWIPMGVTSCLAVM